MIGEAGLSAQSSSVVSLGVEEPPLEEDEEEEGVSNDMTDSPWVFC
jgi:hypothetical protein